MEQFAPDPRSPDPCGDVTEDGAHNRLEMRDSLFLMADMRLADGQQPVAVRVRNLSAGGLMAEVAAGLDQGRRVDFHVRGIGWVAGHVAWCAAGRVGVSFDHQIDPLLARKPVGQGAQTPVYAKPLLSRR